MKQHEMRIKESYPSGAQTWICDECGRQVVVSWRPRFKRIVLVVGDDSATHSGSADELQIESGDVEIIPDAVWEDALNGIDFED